MFINVSAVIIDVGSRICDGGGHIVCLFCVEKRLHRDCGNRSSFISALWIFMAPFNVSLLARWDSSSMIMFDILCDSTRLTIYVLSSVIFLSFWLSVSRYEISFVPAQCNNVYVRESVWKWQSSMNLAKENTDEIWVIILDTFDNVSVWEWNKWSYDNEMLDNKCPTYFILIILKNVFDIFKWNYCSRLRWI